MESFSVLKLCSLLEEKLRNRTSITRFYIGKTSDIEGRSNEHEKEGYSSTTPLAMGTYTNISDAEEKTIKYFLNTDLSTKCMNKVPVSTGKKPQDNEKKIFLYVSVFIEPKEDTELDDDVLDWDTIYEI